MGRQRPALEVPDRGRSVRLDNGPEFTSRAFIDWAQGHGIRHILIEPGRPMQNGYIESFNGRFRDECLNEHWLQTLHQARKEIAAWRRDYNDVRPHSSFGRIPPACFAEQQRRHASADALQASTNCCSAPWIATVLRGQARLWDLTCGN